MRVNRLNVAVLTFLISGCSEKHTSCNAHTVCGSGQHCSADGRCTQECSSDRDCPSGAFCATTCGVCLYLERDGGVLKRATCATAALEERDVFGACRADIDQVTALLAWRAAFPDAGAPLFADIACGAVDASTERAWQCLERRVLQGGAGSAPSECRTTGFNGIGLPRPDVGATSADAADVSDAEGMRDAAADADVPRDVSEEGDVPSADAPEVAADDGARSDVITDAASAGDGSDASMDGGVQ